MAVEHIFIKKFTHARILLPLGFPIGLVHGLNSCMGWASVSLIPCRVPCFLGQFETGLKLMLQHYTNATTTPTLFWLNDKSASLSVFP